LHYDGNQLMTIPLVNGGWWAYVSCWWWFADFFCVVFFSALCSESLIYSRTEVDDMVRKFTNVLLTRTLGGCMASLIRRPCLTLLQV